MEEQFLSSPIQNISDITIQGFNETTIEENIEKSETYKLAIGIICAIISSTCLGSFFVPIRKYYSKDGQIIQFFISISLAFFGSLVQVIQGFPHINYADFIGGFFLSIALVFMIPIVNNIGSCLTFIIWNSVVIISLWCFSFFNLYGELSTSTDMPVAQYLGIVFFIIPIIIAIFVKTSPNDFHYHNENDIPSGVENFTMETSTSFSYDLKEFDEFKNIHSLKSSKRIIALGAAISTGMIIIKFLLPIILVNCKLTKAILFPQNNEIRSYDSLDGLWKFVREPKNSIGYGFLNDWHRYKLETFTNSTVMPVPSSYNDMNADADLRDHIGWVWYQREYIVNNDDCKKRFFLRFGSVNYNAVVFVNNDHVMSHTGGHLPFESEVHFLCNSINKITIAVNNTLSHDTIPPGEFQYRTGNGYTKGFFTTTPGFDFFNYAGILRSVYVIKVNDIFIQSLSLEGDQNGLLKYKIKIDELKMERKKFNIRISDDDIESKIKAYNCQITISDEFNNPVIKISTNTPSGKIQINNPNLWWPRGYGKPTLYKFSIEVTSKDGKEYYDKYTETFGFRTVKLTKDSILINNKKFYCVGFGMHEDSDFRGRGFDPVVMTKDLNLLEWMNGNCYRTSHYPYSEERIYESDRRGIVVILETPAVGLKYFNKPNVIELHKTIIKEMITRDKNHPSIIAWSLANEPWSTTNESEKYFEDMYNTAKELDQSRPVTAVYGPTGYNNDKSAKFMDFICINRYYGWYNNMGYLEIINSSLVYDFINWKRMYDVPLMITEYGADAIIGLESLPSTDFTTNYQNELLIETHKALDNLKNTNIITGEMIWNFADFMTAQSVTRAFGNHKGVFTRQRQPKPAAFTLKERYKRLNKP
uniref:Beta-glucuronidase n=1 Tax=Parastrongyloides trichosuri TaxID=131310 RepID=A0A0N5A1F0_PARTI